MSGADKFQEGWWNTIILRHCVFEHYIYSYSFSMGSGDLPMNMIICWSLIITLYNIVLNRCYFLDYELLITKVHQRCRAYFPAIYSRTCMWQSTDYFQCAWALLMHILFTCKLTHLLVFTNHSMVILTITALTLKWVWTYNS